MAADKHAEISKIKLENLLANGIVIDAAAPGDSARNYQLTRNIRIEMGSDPYDWLANNFINLGPHTFDGCGNSITINNSYGIIDGVEIEPGYATMDGSSWAIVNLDYFMKGQSALFKVSSGAVIKQLGWHGNAPIGSVSRSSTTSASLTEWHSSGGLIREQYHSLNSEGLPYVTNTTSSRNIGNLTLEDIHCTRTRQLFCGIQNYATNFRFYDNNGMSCQTGGLIPAYHYGNIIIKRCYYKRSYDYNVLNAFFGWNSSGQNVEDCYINLNNRPAVKTDPLQSLRISNNEKESAPEPYYEQYWRTGYNISNGGQCNRHYGILMPNHAYWLNTIWKRNYVIKIIIHIPLTLNIY